jgi:hypothetical protein
MKRFWAAIAVVFVFTIPSFAAADSIDADQYVVHASVAPSHFVIINAHDTITEIISNSPLQASPTIYEDSVKVGNKRTLTPQLNLQYLGIMTGLHGSLVGIIYHPSPGEKLSTPVSFAPNSYQKGRVNHAQNNLFFTHSHSMYGPLTFTAIT